MMGMKGTLSPCVWVSVIPGSNAERSFPKDVLLHEKPRHRLTRVARAGNHAAVDAAIDAREREDGIDDTTETLAGNETCIKKDG